MGGKNLRVFKEVYEEGFGGLLQRQDRRALPSQPGAIFAVLVRRDKVIGDLSYQACKGQLAQE